MITAAVSVVKEKNRSDKSKKQPGEFKKEKDTSEIIADGGPPAEPEQRRPPRRA